MKICVWIIFYLFLYFWGNVQGKCECGKAEYPSNARIFNGMPAFEKQFLWQLLIWVSYKDDKGKKRKVKAGGTLISRKHFLTFAHAFYERDDNSRYINNNQKRL